MHAFAFQYGMLAPFHLLCASSQYTIDTQALALPGQWTGADSTVWSCCRQEASPAACSPDCR